MGKLRYVIVNPGDYNKLYTSHLFVLGIGAYRDEHYLVWTSKDAADDALEAVVEYKVDNDLLYSLSREEDVFDELGEEPTEENIEKLYNGAFDMSLAHGGYGGSSWWITSYEWSLHDAPKDIRKIAQEASQRYIDEDEDAVPVIEVEW